MKSIVPHKWSQRGSLFGAACRSYAPPAPCSPLLARCVSLGPRTPLAPPDGILHWQTPGSLEKSTAHPAKRGEGGGGRAVELSGDTVMLHGNFKYSSNHTHMHQEACTYTHIHPPIYPSIHPSVHPSIHLFIHLSIHPSIHPSIHALLSFIQSSAGHIRTHIHTHKYGHTQTHTTHACPHRQTQTHTHCAT